MQKTRASKDLFDLIKSMSATEKRHFRLYSSKGDGKDEHYLRLFDTLEKQTVFDDEVAFGKLGISPRSRYARIKNYLYKALLESLEDYYRDSSLDAKFLHLINRVAILKHKRLYGQAEKLLAKAEKLAEQKNTGMYQIIGEHRRLNLLCNSEDIKSIDKHLSEYEDRKQVYLEKAGDHLDLQMITLKVNWLLRYGELGEHRHTHWVEELNTHPLMTRLKYPDDLEYTLYFYNLKGLIAGLVGNEAEDHKYRRAYLDAYQSNPEYIKRWPMNYIIALGNVAEGAAETGEVEELLECTAELRAFVAKYNIRNPSSMEPLIYSNSYILEMEAYESFSPERRASLVEQLEKTYKRYHRRVTPILRLSMQYGIGRHYFYFEDYEQSENWLSKIVQQSDEKLSTTHQLASRLLYCLIQYERQNDRFLEGLIKTYRDWMRKRKISSPALKLFFRLLKSSLYKSRSVDYWKENREELISALRSPDDAWLRKRVELEKWVDKKAGIRAQKRAS